MNAERLHAIALALKKEIDSQNLIPCYQEMVNSLQRAVSQPQQPAHQNAVSQQLSRVYAALEHAPSDLFSPVWRQTLDEIGGVELVGKPLAAHVRRIFERNQITPATALDELKQMFEALQKFKQAIDSTIQGLGALNIGAEELESGECEVGVLIPRAAIKNNLNALGEELKELNFIFGTFSELATGQRENYKVKSLSSTELMVFLAAIPPVAACIAHAAEKVANFYKTLLEIRKHKAELKALGLKETEMKGIADHANAFMQDKIEKLTVEIVDSYYKSKDQPRRNELRNSVTIALNRIATRIDQGFNIEVRVGPVPDEKDEGKKASAKDLQQYIAIIQGAREGLQFLKLKGDSILHLPDSTAHEKPEKKK